jgi:hypothetical protein
MLDRKRVAANLYRKRTAAIHIQRIARGHSLRIKLWSQVIELRATKITAACRGFLVRNRRFHLVAKVIYIQRRYRAWLRKPPEFRAKASDSMRERKAKAARIQEAFRQHAEKKEISRIQQEKAALA